MKKGFTLAETLITIGIIGIVAAITMPILFAQHREKQIVAQLKKIYSSMSQAYALALVEYGDPTVWGLDAKNSSVGANKINEILSPYYKVIDNCRTNSGCWVNSEILYLNKTSSGINIASETKFSTFEIADGTLIAYRVIDPACKDNKGTSRAYQNVCAEVYVDVNGRRHPNQLGYDIHRFYITQYGYVPAGYIADTETSFEDTCLTNHLGTGCTGWIVQKENMDYLHCNDLSWNSKHRCTNIFNYNYNYGL